MTTVVLAGNPNSGKTTLFNRLTGARQKVANYPGVTVETREGVTHWGGKKVRIVDLPGAYSLLGESEDERIAFDVLREDDVAVVLAVLDVNVLSRGIYFVLSLLELGKPVVVALNMMDELEAAGSSVDIDLLSRRLACPVIPIVAAKGIGLTALEAELSADVSKQRGRTLVLEAERHERVQRFAAEYSLTAGTALWWIGYAHRNPGAQDREARGAREVLADLPHLATESVEARHRLAREICSEVLIRGDADARSLRRRLDRWLLHPIFGVPIFVAVMFVLFQSIFSWAEPAMGLIEGAVSTTQEIVRGAGSGALIDLLADGVVGGVGNVVVFVPQIAFLFLFIAILEDSGYLARVALLADRLMAGVGLHGRAFVPLLSGFACAVPAIMSTRTIENQRDRLVTILVTPLMSCSARLPVYTLIIGSLFAADQRIGFVSVGGTLLFGLYTASIAFAIGVTFVLKRTLLAGPVPPLTLELPPYRMPGPGDVMKRVAERVWVFLREAGTVILAISIVLWALLYFPRPEPNTPPQVAIEESIAGTLGHVIEPVIEPLGYNWQIGVGLLASFAAREVLVSTLAMVHGQDPELDPEDPSLRATLQTVRDQRTGELVYTPLVGASLLIFFLLAAQCMSTLAIIKRETRSWGWTLFSLSYMNAMAWVGAFMVYQGGLLLGFT